MQFSDLGLSRELLSVLTDIGYTTPTPIQEKAIPVALQRKDILGIAQTGTGKTAGFTLPMLDLLAQGRPKARMPRSLILEPTRELAAQVAESFEKYGKNHKLSMALLIGGVSFEEQNKKLDRGVDVLIATPGRLLDHFERGRLMMSQVQILVIDEADRMLDMGFIPDIERICKLLPFTRQTMLFSATMPPEIQKLADQFLSSPERVEVARPATTVETIAQHMSWVPSDHKAKRAVFRALLRSQQVQNAIVFCNRKRDVDILAKSMARHGFNAAPIHGDLDQSVRTATLDKFRSGQLQYLIASDVAARGLDIPMVSHVFNFDVPIHADDYVHRIGRTGRAGRLGASFTLVARPETKYLEAIVKLTGKEIAEFSIDGIAEIAAQAEDGREERRGGRSRGGRGRDRHEGGAEGRGRRERSDRPSERERREPELVGADAPRGKRADAGERGVAANAPSTARSRSAAPARRARRARRFKGSAITCRRFSCAQRRSRTRKRSPEPDSLPLVGRSRVNRPLKFRHPGRDAARKCCFQIRDRTRSRVLFLQRTTACCAARTG
ncbi:MAG: DEAD/DEAH box helicase [Alphaproteobacteria bacterium]